MSQLTKLIEYYRPRSHFIIINSFSPSIVGSVVECSPATRAARVRFPDDAIFFITHLKGENQKVCKKFGDAGYRSPYLSHAKRALYHLSYVPQLQNTCQSVDVYCDCWIFGAFILCLRLWNPETFDSSVGRAVDCSSWNQISIGRWFKSGSKDF